MGPSATLPSASPDYAEALINPIKHVSLMDQRAKQLAALIGESEVSLRGGRAPARLGPGTSAHDCCGCGQVGWLWLTSGHGPAGEVPAGTQGFMRAGRALCH